MPVSDSTIGLALKITADAKQAEAALRALTDTYAQTLQKIAQSTNQVAAAQQQSARVSSEQFQASERNALVYAQAVARLQQAQGNAAAAAQTLTQAIADSNQASLESIRAQIQLANLQNDYANSPLISAVRGQVGAFDELEKSATEAGAALAQAVQSDGKSGGFSATLKSFGDIAGSISNLVTLVLVAEQAQQRLQNSSVNLGDVLRGVFRNSAAEVAKFQQQVEEVAQATPAASSEDLLTFISRVNREIVEESRRGAEAAKKAGADIAAGLAQGLKADTGKAAKAAKDAADSVVAATRKELGIESPSRVFRLIGEQTIEGFIAGVKAKASAAQATIRDAIGGSGTQPGRAQGLLADLLPGNARAQQIGSLIDGASARLTGFEARALASTTAIVGLSAGVASLAVGLGTLAAGALVAIPALVKLGSAGVQANAQLEQIGLGIASIVASVGQLQNADGVQLKGVDALNAALSIAREQLELLRVDALNTALSFEQVADGFLQAVGPGLAAGLNLDQVRKTVIDLSQLIVPLTGNAAQLGQELRAIFSGDINQDTQVANALQITKEQIETAKEAGRLAEFLNEKLSIAAVTGARMAQTFSAATSNLREAGTVLSQRVTEGFFSQLRDKLNATLPQIFTTAAGKVDIAPQFKGLADTIQNLFDRLGANVALIIDFLIEKTKELSNFLNTNRADVNLLFDSIQSLVNAIGNLGNTIAIALGRNAGSTLQFLIGLIKQVGLGVAELQDIAEVFGAVFLGVIQTITLAIETGLQKALSLIGLEIKSLDDDITRLRNSLDAVRTRLDQGNINTQRTQAELDEAERLKDVQPIDPRTFALLEAVDRGGKPTNARLTGRPPALDTGNRSGREKVIDREAAAARAQEAIDKLLLKARQDVVQSLRDNEVLRAATDSYVQSLENAIERQGGFIALLEGRSQRFQEVAEAGIDAAQKLRDLQNETAEIELQRLSTFFGNELIIAQARAELQRQAELDRFQAARERIKQELEANKVTVGDDAATAAAKLANQQLLNSQLEDEQKRHKARLDLINRERGLAEQQADPSSNLSLFGVSNDGLSRLDALGQSFRSTLTALSASAGNFKTIMGGALQSVTAGIGNMIQAMILSGTAGPQALRKLAAGAIAAVAAQALVKAIFETAEGFAQLAIGNVDGAVKHFTSAGYYAAVGGVAGAVGAALGAGIRNDAAGANAGIGGAVAGNVGSQAPEQITHNRPLTAEEQERANLAQSLRAQAPGAGLLGSAFNRMADGIERLDNKISSMRPEDVLTVGVDRAPRVVGNAVIAATREDGTIGRELASNLGF